MFVVSNTKYVFLITFLSACQPSIKNLNLTNDDLAFKNEIILYKEKPYSGTLFSKNDTLTTYQAMYVDGKKHGKEQKFFYNGTIAELRFYTQGKKSGTHRSWWNKEQLKSEYHFDNTGHYIGLQQEWYPNGQLAKEFNYTNGKENGTQKTWNSAGQITANYVVINGERFGFIGSKSCKYVKNN